MGFLCLILLRRPNAHVWVPSPHVSVPLRVPSPAGFKSQGNEGMGTKHLTGPSCQALCCAVPSAGRAWSSLPCQAGVYAGAHRCLCLWEGSLGKAGHLVARIGILISLRASSLQSDSATLWRPPLSLDTFPWTMAPPVLPSNSGTLPLLPRIHGGSHAALGSVSALPEVVVMVRVTQQGC